MSKSAANSRRRQSSPVSADILLYRREEDGLRVLLAHPGGPFFANKDAGAWTIPKGLIESDEEPARAALREFEEELGWKPRGELQALGDVRLKSGKRVIAFALQSHESEEELLARFAPGTFTMEWPRGTGRLLTLPEVDRIAFFSNDEARVAINAAQAAFLDRLSELAKGGPS